eukprot:gene20428-27216_t
MPTRANANVTPGPNCQAAVVRVSTSTRGTSTRTRLQARGAPDGSSTSRNAFVVPKPFLRVRGPVHRYAASEAFQPATSASASKEPVREVKPEDVVKLRLSPLRAPFDTKYLAGLAWQQKGPLTLAAICVLFCTMSNLAAPVLSGMLVEMLVKQGPMESYAKVLGILVFGYVMEPLLTKVYMDNVMLAGERILATLRLELFRMLLMQKISYFDKHSASELTSLISVELDAMRSFVFNNVSRDRGIRAVLEATGSVIVLFCLSWRLAPVSTIMICTTAVAAALYRAYTRGIEQKQGQALQRMSSVALQALANMRTVRSFAGESLERERFQDHVATSYEAGVSFSHAKSWFEASNRAAIHASLLTLYGWGGWLVSQGLLPIGVLITGIGFTFSLTYATQGSVNTLSELRRASGALSRVRKMMSESEVDPSMHAALPPGAWWEVANGKDHVVEPYAAQLSHCCSGSLWFYEPQEGSIWMNGKPTNTFTQGEWARAVAMVGQEPVLFSGTIGDNISYGKFGVATEEEIKRAAVAANADEFICRLPEGYNTLVGERGGQRQRIAIARALLKDSPIIILDEATSALDAVSEKLVQQAIQRLVNGRTVLVIAHRLSTVMNADQIVVMANGKVADVGSHEELSERSTIYNDLMNFQELILAST